MTGLAIEQFSPNAVVATHERLRIGGIHDPPSGGGSRILPLLFRK